MNVMAAGHLSDVCRIWPAQKEMVLNIIEPERLGTGGAIKLGWQHLSRPNDPVMVLNGIFSALRCRECWKN